MYYNCLLVISGIFIPINQNIEYYDSLYCFIFLQIPVTKIRFHKKGRFKVFLPTEIFVPLEKIYFTAYVS